MGQKVNPVGMRLGIIRNWDSKWYAEKTAVPALVKEDALIREYLNDFYKKAAVSHVEIERVKGKGGKDRVKVTLHTAKPGIVIGRDAETKKKAVAYLEKFTKKEIVFNVVEVKRPERVATLVAQSIAEQLENRASFRRVQKIAMQRALKSGAKGVKTLVSGRLGGAEIARSEGYSEGQVPLHTLRADIDYATAEAHTTYGVLGIKVWIYNGEVLPGQTREENLRKQDERAPRQDRERRAPRENKGNARDSKGGK
ncbi:MAG: 30S ribosomal protein S3 [Tenericutes bacterium GWC2_34_14]|nr:MAG: 30S ribosomal protein S3 [Tenericutes bacterium GWA2_35_7]OHE29058.1 MAG: 30S ribosomal protein S3 [Tenericutes bacterium GWC2_34_14]OHE34011.1 MAG: 30S ribosomal protein S3 [Tenericutes bacterium GWE2_34_108]OHE35344.1 MAG: 30S ribosomal protein S3 [Tenericutes bacterium GWF1_35_14]OHE38377.1 MAG: 30S ribosomal protein S3 [Tenericutes bacterium GWF2_35_184]OHE42712.1 MAG: 30S ribosomal protein S3 [Tenericutes bacterium RIFOXYA2_FULL_36_32]OHE43238.1 MAG: 30S ribosomal protein S3 [Ten